tara:strand:- start:849 stop:1079 length:231 start_codon:yes stop_codon:yes gene_type:complete
MIVVTLQRNKCIGCNYCVELTPAYFRMSKKDGKSILLHSEEKRGFFTLKITDNSEFETCELAAKACPVKIISTKLI